ncbi:NAD(P)-dependent oxidoreductase [soil metagenome]
MIAFLGMGLLGSNFVRALRKRGEEVHVWNRTKAKADALESVGAKAFADPADAVRGATRVHLTLSDDAAVDDVLARALPGLAADVLVIDHTTTSTGGALARMTKFRGQKITFVHAPVFMGPQNALESTGLMLLSGDRALIERITPLVAPMTGKVVDLGPKPEAAASFKLLGNLFLMFLTSGLADMLGLAKALGVAPAEAATLFEHFNPGATVAMRMKRMVDANFADPSWELTMARKDARIMLEEAEAKGVKLGVLPAIAKRMDNMIEAGHGADDWTVLAKDFV